MHCYDGLCPKCRAVKKVVFGVLVLLNAFVWPAWTGIDGWITFFAVLIILMGILKFFWPSCGHCNCGVNGIGVCKPAKKK